MRGGGLIYFALRPYLDSIMCQFPYTVAKAHTVFARASEVKSFERPFAASQCIGQWLCMADLGKGPHHVREGVWLEIFQATFHHLSGRICKLWRGMADCGKGPHCVREGVEFEIIQATFCHLSKRVKSTGSEWLIVENAHTTLAMA